MSYSTYSTHTRARTHAHTHISLLSTIMFTVHNQSKLCSSENKQMFTSN